MSHTHTCTRQLATHKHAPANLTITATLPPDVGANTETVGIVHEKTKELGGYGEYAAALETQLGVVPSALTDIVAGSLPKVALTSYKALVWYAGAKNDSLWKRSPKVS